MTPPPGSAQVLAGLHDVVVPQPVSLMPATPAWLVLLTLLAGFVLWTTVRLRRRWQRDRYRREAGVELEQLAAHLASGETRGPALAALPVLVKRVALRIAPREDVAARSGEEWLALLDRTWPEPAFSRGPGRLLPEIAYGDPARLQGLSAPDLEALVNLLRRWVRRHRPPPHQGSRTSPSRSAGGSA